MQRILFNDGWQYRDKVNPFAEPGRTAMGYQDIVLPHDAMIAQRRDPELALGASVAYFPGGVYEYRKVFDLPAEIEGQRVIFEFEGVYRDAVVHVNGDYTGQRPSGRIRLDHSLRKTPEVRSRRRRRTGPDPLPRRLRRERLLGTR